MRFSKQYGKPESPSLRKAPVIAHSDFQLSEALGIFSDMGASSGSDSSDSSLDFESSFYRFKTEEKTRLRPSEPSSEMEEIGELLGTISKPALPGQVVAKPQQPSPKFNRFSFGTQIREEPLTFKDDSA